MTFRISLSFAVLVAIFLTMMASSRCHGFGLFSTSPSCKTHSFVSNHQRKNHVTSRQGNLVDSQASTALRQAVSSDSDDDKTAKLQKATKAMTAFTNKYLQNTDTRLCQDLGVAAVVIQGLAEHKVELGAPLCPCRFYEDKHAEARDGYWNCPCVPMRERHECHCMLFLTEDNAFVGDQQRIDFEQVQTLNANVQK
jgi:ferredoxin-thioredoxin reductase catalytic chain